MKIVLSSNNMQKGKTKQNSLNFSNKENYLFIT